MRRYCRSISGGASGAALTWAHGAAAVIHAATVEGAAATRHGRPVRLSARTPCSSNSDTAPAGHERLHLHGLFIEGLGFSGQQMSFLTHVSRP